MFSSLVFNCRYGKTSIVDELSRACLQRGVILARGKFAQVNTTPFVAWQQVLTQLVDIALTSSAQEETAWRVALKSALGPNAAVLIDIVPSLAALIGTYPPVATLPPSETLARFQDAFVSAIVAFASSELETPVVVFIDDNHWADISSIKLLELLVRETYVQSPEQTQQRPLRLMVIAAYRPPLSADDQHSPLAATSDQHTHADTSPWTQFVHQCLSRSFTTWPLTVIELLPLELGDVVHLLADTLKVEPRKVERLALTCYQRTRGAPLFIKQWLMELHERGLLTLKVSDAQQLLPAADHSDAPTKVSGYDPSSRASSANSTNTSVSDPSTQATSDIAVGYGSGTDGRAASPAFNQWQWDDNVISSLQMSNDVVTLMSNRISHFPPETRHVLAVAAALGSSFQFGVLAAVTQKSDKQLTSLLWPAVKAGLVYPLGSVLLEPDLQDADVNARMTSVQAKLSSHTDIDARGKDTPESDDDIIAKTNAMNAPGEEPALPISDDEAPAAPTARTQHDKRRSTELQYVSVLSVAHEQSSPATSRSRNATPDTLPVLPAVEQRSSTDDRSMLGFTSDNRSELRNAYFKFSHDRIVGACMATLTQPQLRKLHQQIGQQLLQQLKDELKLADGHAIGKHGELAADEESQLCEFIRLVADANSDTVLRIVHHQNLAYGLIELPAPDTSDDQQAASFWQSSNKEENGTDDFKKLSILQQDELVHLNQIAMQRARVYTAYKVAVDYTRAGISIVSPEYWASGNDRQYKLILALYNALSELELVLGNLPECKKAADQIIEHARTAVDKTEAYVTLITHATFTAAYRRGLQIAVEASRAVGFPLEDVERNIGKPYTDLALQKLNRLRTQQVMCDIVDRYNKQRGIKGADARQELRERNVLLTEEHDDYSGYELGQPALPLPSQTKEALSIIPDLPDATDVKAVSAMSIVCAAAICSFLENPVQRDLMGCTVLQLALRLNAISSSVATNLCLFGVGLAFRHNVADIGYEIATQAYELANRRQDQITSGRALYLRAVVAGHMHRPMRSLLPDFKTSHQMVKLSGDALYKVYTVVCSLMPQITCGTRLSEVQPLLQPYLTVAQKASNGVALHICMSVQAIVGNLLGQTAAPDVYHLTMPDEVNTPPPIDAAAGAQMEKS